MDPFDTLHRFPSPRAVARCGVVLLTTSLLALGGLSPAGAVNVDHGDQVVNDDPANFTPQVMNGSVQSFVQIGDKIVAAGSFTTVRQTPTGADINRNGIFAFDATTGAIDPGFNPNLGGPANSVDTDGEFVYVGGSFGSVSGQPSTKRVAKLTADGALVPGFSVPNSAVNEVVVRGDRLFIGGKFSAVGGVPRGALAVLDTGTGSVLPEVDVPFTGTYNGGGTGITRMDVDPAGSQVVAVGNFVTVGGQSREQIAIVDTPAGAAATVSPWSTQRFSMARNGGCAGVFDTWTRDIDISPDGAYFAVTTTGAFGGGANSGTLCDTTTRWELGGDAGGQEPSWITYTGGDTSYGVAITGSAVYTGGHMRWQNNSFQGDQAGPGAVPREGISALDPVNGLPLSWNPGRARGVGAEALYATPQGLWVGSDTLRIAGELRQRLALMPLAGGTTIAPLTEPVLPNDVFVAERAAAGASGVLYRTNAGGAPVQSADTGPDWASDSGFVTGGNTASWGSGVPFDATVPASTPAQIFATERYAQQSYDFPVEAGKQLEVRLYFANQCGCTSAAGQRIFDVSIDGALVMNDFDIVAATGDKRGTMREFTVTSDGIVDIDLTNNVENAVINGIEIIDTAAAGGTPVQGALVQRSLDGSGAPAAGTGTVVNTEMDWSLVRGATLAGGTLYYGLPDGALYARTFDPQTAATGPQRAVNLYDDPETGERIPFAIANLTGLVFDAATHRLYYTTFGDSRLFFRYFTPESEVVGADTFTAPATGIDFSTAAGLSLASGRLLYGSSADGSLSSVPFTAGAVTGSPTVVSTDGTWRYRDMFVSPLGARPVNQAPTATFTATCDDQRTCTFDATGSTDPDGTVASYAWDFGDTTTATGALANHTYTDDGTLTVTLTVTDDDGATGESSQAVTVTLAEPPANEPPVAAFTADCSALTCSFDGSGSTDADGTIASYAWDFGDGSTATGATTDHAYATAGDYPVTLTVTDTQGATGQRTQTVTVTDAPAPAGDVAFRDATSSTGNLITTWVTIPASVQAGDALVLSLTQNGPRDIGAPAGAGTWTDLGTQTGNLDQIRTTNWVKVAETGDTGRSVSVTLSSRAKVTLSLVAYSGTDTADPVASYASASETAFTASHTTPGATGVPAGAFVVSGWADKTSGTADWTDPTGETERVERIGIGAGRVSAQITDSGPVAAGNYAGLTATALTSAGADSMSRKAITWTLVLSP